MSQTLTDYLHQELPLANALGVCVVNTQEWAVHLTAPFAPNRNNHGTAFGGSLATLGILSGWAMVHSALLREGLDADLVIQKSECDYHQPITGEIHAHAQMLPADWQAFLAAYATKGRGRITVRTQLAGVSALTSGATHTGTYVALKRL